MCGIANAPEDYSFEDLVKLRALCTRIETLIYNQYTPKLISAHDFIKNEFEKYHKCQPGRCYIYQQKV